jgi:hypothetical protein
LGIYKHLPLHHLSGEIVIQPGHRVDGIVFDAG